MYKPNRLIVILAILAVLIPTTAAMIQRDSIPITTTIVEEPVFPDYTDDEDYPYFYGRLYIDSVGIDVALYRDKYNKQSAVDRQDSACYFRMSNGGWLIADHNTQAFSTLLDVEVGAEATIVLQNGEIQRLVCVEVLDGINTGHGLTDKNRKVQHGRYDIAMYTCISNWQDIRICHWEFIKEE